MIQKADWIAPAGAENIKPCHFRAKKEVEFSVQPSSLIVQIACDSHYYLEVNGQYVGRGPCRGTRQVAFYDEYDVANLIHPGKNSFEVLVCCMNFQAELSYPITPAVRMAIGDVAVSDVSWETSLCTSEWISDGPVFTPQSGYAEYRNCAFIKCDPPSQTISIPQDSLLRLKQVKKRDIPMPIEHLRLPVDVPAAAFVPACDLDDPAFAKISTAEAHFPLPAGCEAKLYTLVSGDDADLTLPLPPDNGGITMVFDFGKEISGLSKIELTAPAGCVADIVYEEELFKGDRLRADHTHTNPRYNFAERYILADGRQTIGTVLMERGFRMFQLTLRNCTAPVTLHTVRAVDRRYPFAGRGQFFCGDYQLNRLWETSAETLSACTTDMFTDCPWRERLFYCNDFYIENRTAIKIFGDKALHRRALRLIFSQNRKDKLFTSCAPSIANEIPDNGKTDFHIILSGDLTLPMMVKEYYMHTKDADMVKEVFVQLKEMLAQFTSWKDADSIIRPPLKYWNFIDWSFELNGMDFSGKRTALINFLYILSARALRFLADIAGVDPGIEEADLQIMLNKTVEIFYSKEENCFLNSIDDPRAADSQLKALGVPPETADNVAQTSRLVHAMAALAGADEALCRPVTDENLLTPELYYCLFLLDAMEQSGLYADALKLIRRHWGSMLDSGTPTLWENGVHQKGKAGFGGSASLCHGFSSAPAAFLQTAVLGVRPTEAGFERFSFDPKYPEFRFAHGTVPTPNGAIRCRWQAENGKFSAWLHVPEMCVADTPAGVLEAGDHEISWAY